MSWYRTAAGRRLAPLLAVLALVLVAGCTAGSSTSSTSAPASAVNALDFTGTTLTDQPFNGATLKGTPVVLWFWAPWCTVCRAEAPDVAAVAAQYAGRVTFLGVPGLGQVDAMKAFVAETGTSGFQHVSDVDGSLWQRFGVVSQPSFVFVDGSGSAQRIDGGLGASDLQQHTQALLSASAGT